MAAQADAIDALRAVLASDGIEAIKFLNTTAALTDDLAQAASIQLGNVGTFEKSVPTRLLRSRNAPAASSESTATPQSSPDDFFALDAVIFAVQSGGMQGGLYVVQATSRGYARFDAIERPDILAYLFGKREEWEGVLSDTELKRRLTFTQEAISTTPPTSPPAALRELYKTTAKLPPKRAYVPSKTDAAFVKRLKTSGTEIVLRTRNDALHGSHPWMKQADFSSLRQALAPQIEAVRKAAGADGSAAAARLPPQSSNVSARGPERKQRAQDPIIMLSNSPTSLITMFNVKSLLEEGVFVDPSEARRIAQGQTEGIVSILHRLPSQQDPNARPTRFLVVDNVDALSRLGTGGQDVWARVVAVFTTGQVWQFKAYRWSEARELFRHVLGVYARYHNETQNATVRDWPISELIIDRFKRHTDMQIVAHFWRNVDNYISRKKPHML